MANEPTQPRLSRAVAEVLAVASPTPCMRRVTVGGAELAAFLRAEGVDEPAAWVKLFLPSGEGRAYTIRGIDHDAASLDLDIVLHGDGPQAGPASTWAADAQPGARVGIAGPRSGGFLLPADARWVLLAGDITALPALQRIASALPAGLKAKVYVELPSQADRQPIDGAAKLRTDWLLAREGPGVALCQTLLHRPLPAGPGYLWMAGESSTIRRLRQHYLLERGIERHRVSAKGYWKAGEADHRDA